MLVVKTLAPELVVSVADSPGFGTNSERVSEEAIRRELQQLLVHTIRVWKRFCVSQAAFIALVVQHFTISC